MMLSPDILSQIETAAPGSVSEIGQSYLEEPRGAFHGAGSALVRPRSTSEVSGVVKAAGEYGVPIVPFGGGTGLVGGQVREAVGPTLVLSLERMAEIRDVDPRDKTMVAGAGAILADIQRAAKAKGLIFPLSLASEGSCRIGGNLATNAGGVNVLRYGTARELCLGLEAVLPDGSVFNGLKRLRKDNTGYDLRNLLIGSEGTLGIITAARLKLFPVPGETMTGLFELASLDAALDLLLLLQSRLGDVVSAHELIHRTGIDMLTETMPDISLPPTGESEWLVLTEAAGGFGGGLADRFESCIASAFESGFVTNGSIAQSGLQRDQFWTMRESLPEANRRTGSVSSHDISLPISDLSVFVQEAGRAVAEIDPNLRINCFGHVGDGNLHYNVFPPKDREADEFAQLRQPVRDTVYGLVDRFGGSISAEHGIGRLKKADLVKFGDPAKLTVMRAIKTTLDPKNIMNPGAVLDV